MSERDDKVRILHRLACENGRDCDSTDRDICTVEKLLERAWDLGFDAGRAEERRDVVAWLRADCPCGYADCESRYARVAVGVERGDHVPIGATHTRAGGRDE